MPKILGAVQNLRKIEAAMLAGYTTMPTITALYELCIIGVSSRKSKDSGSYSITTCERACID